MKVEHTLCYILHRRDYLESSLILEVISREYGRVSLVVKGAKRNKKQQGMAYNLYQKYYISWSGKTELGTLTDIEFATAMNSLSPDKMMSGFYMNEIILRLFHKHEPHSDLFDSYDSAINKLSENKEENELLRYFEKHLLQSLGYGVVFDQDVDSGDAINIAQSYCYVINLGPSSDIKNQNTGINVSGKTLLELDNETLSSPESKKEAKTLLRTLLNQYLGSKPLASRQLYHSYIKNKQPV